MDRSMFFILLYYYDDECLIKSCAVCCVCVWLGGYFIQCRPAVASRWVGGSTQILYSTGTPALYSTRTPAHSNHPVVAHTQGVSLDGRAPLGDSGSDRGPNFT